MSSSDHKLELIEATYARLQSWRAVARELGLPRSTVRHYQRLISKAPLPVAEGDTTGLTAKKRALPRGAKIKRYILTSAQNNTYVHEAAWMNLVALAEHYDAEIMISRFAYNKAAYTQPVKPGTGGAPEDKDLWYDPELEGHYSDERVELAPGLVWCGESNISPTAVRPLSGLDTYTGRKSAIFPHIKITMESVASGKNEGVKLLFTTGTVTMKNYIQRKAGLKAEFHHTYGALLVEVNSKGTWFCRQLNAKAEDGVIHDLTLRVENSVVTDNNTVEAVTFGDIHAAQLDPGVADLGWGVGGMIDVLKPNKVFLHDLIDFRARNHHDRGNPHLNFEKFINGVDGVQAELQEAVELVLQMHREGIEVVVVQSNHDNALTRWLREADYRSDPKNAMIFLKCQLRKYQAIEVSESSFHMLEWVLRELGCPKGIRFLREDESYVICREHGGGIECGMHGHDGPNGTRGTAWTFRKMGRRANIGHSHSAAILEGLFVAGTSSKLDVGYNTGPSSWTHSHIVTYPNGKRAVITMYGGAWRAEEKKG
jgi:hypothetical protein